LSFRTKEALAWAKDAEITGRIEGAVTESDESLEVEPVEVSPYDVVEDALRGAPVVERSRSLLGVCESGS